MKLPTLLVVSLLIACLPARTAARTDPLARARLLHRSAKENLADPTLDSRTRVTRQLEEAISLDPGGEAGNHWLLLGLVRELGRYDKDAAQCYRSALAQDPGNREALLGIGRVTKRQFIRTLDREALREGIAVLDSATRCFPPSSEPWLALVPFLYEWPDLPRASQATERALRGRPRLPLAVMAAGMMAYRNGDVERADSLFRAGIARLDPVHRVVYTRPERYVGRPRADAAPGPAPRPDPRPGPPSARVAAAAIGPDPDPTTRTNELLLEYWARATHAILLFDDPIRPSFDGRAEAFLRYGPPAKVLWNPLGMNLYYRPDPNRVQWSDNARSGSLERYPFAAQIWYYPDLNMQLLFHDRALDGHYSVPALREPIENSYPDPDVLAKRRDLLDVADGFAIFPTLPPREQRLRVVPTLASFEGAAGPRLVAFVQAPAETLDARWVVTDASGRTVAQDARATERSLCADGAGSGMQFSAELPPGRYDVAVSARDGRGRRGVASRSVTLRRPDGLLSLSDIVLCCGDPSMLVERGAVRLDPLPDGVARGTAPLSAYFEIYRLGVAPDGTSRYTFDYTVESIERDPRTGRTAPTGTVATWASREEVFRGDRRRQFLVLPIASLRPGEYRLTVTVRDLVGGMTEVGSATFERR